MPSSYATPRTLVDALREIPKRDGRGFRFLGQGGAEHFFLYADLEREAHRRAAHLRAHGLAKGDRLAMVIPEGHEFVLTFLGACVAGVVPVPIHPRATFKGAEGYQDVVAHISEAAGAKVLITMESTRPFVEPVLGRGVGLEKMLLAETAFSGDTPAFTAPEIAPSDLCFLQFTSGSTSKPKGVQVTHANLVANASAFLGPHGLDRRDADVAYAGADGRHHHGGRQRHALRLCR